MNVRRVLYTLPQIYQAAHQNLNICEGSGTVSYFILLIKASVHSFSFYMENRQIHPINNTHPHLYKIQLQPSQNRRLQLRELQSTMDRLRGRLPLYKHGMLPINLLQTGLLFCKLSDTQSTLKIRLYWIQSEMVHLLTYSPFFKSFISLCITPRSRK